MKLKIFGAIFCIMLIIAITICSRDVSAEDKKIVDNRFNVMVLLDNSNSMNYTDPDKNRMEAIGLFVNLLTKDGNTIGNVVFSNEIDSYQDIILADGQKVKNDFLDNLSNNNPTGYTNTGLGLEMAVNKLIEQGNPDLNSVVLYLSDGNTEMPDEKSLNESLEAKADAIQKARENGIKIYSVCLNANQEADVSEMQQISEATGGIFQEVQNSEDLKEVFNRFYSIVYGLETILIGEETFNDNGVVERDFTIPSFGVEEVNIIIYGKVDDVEITNPQNAKVELTTIQSNTYTIVKFDEVEGGNWHFKAFGNPGTQIKVNMIFNTDLSIDIFSNYEEYTDGMTKQDDLIFNAKMKSNESLADQDYQYEGYSARLICMDAYRKVISDNNMDVQNGSFVSSVKLDQGIYYFKAVLEGNYIEKESVELGPYEIIADNNNVSPSITENTPPFAINKNPMTITRLLFPFKDNSYTIKFDEIAKDNEDTELKYELVSSSYMINKDYDLYGDKIVLHHYSLGKGAFTIRAYDSKGEYCDVEIIIKRIRVTIVTAILTGIIILVLLTLLVIDIYKKTLVPFRGKIFVTTYRKTNVMEKKPDSAEKERGIIKLKSFDVHDFKIKNALFQASGREYIDFITRTPLYLNGLKKIKKIRIYSNGSSYIFTLAPIEDEMILTEENRIEISFLSTISGDDNPPVENTGNFYSDVGVKKSDEDEFLDLNMNSDDVDDAEYESGMDDFLGGGM